MIGPFRVIDFHAHLGRWPKVGMAHSLDEMIAVMDRSGVDRVCVFNIFHGRAARGNDHVAEARRRFPDRVVGFAFVTPHYEDEMVPELARAFDELGMRAIKLYPPYANRALTDPCWEPVFRFASERGVPVMSHSWQDCPLCGPEVFATVADKFPDVPLVMGHGGGTDVGRQQAIAAAQRCPNLHLEICSSYRSEGSIEAMVEPLGPERVLLGSDLPLMDPRLHIGRVLSAGIDDHAKSQILGANAARLLKL